MIHSVNSSLPLFILSVSNRKTSHNRTIPSQTEKTSSPQVPLVLFSGKMSGSYSKLLPNQETQDRLDKYIAEAGIPNSVPKEKIHLSIINSTSSIDMRKYSPLHAGLEIPPGSYSFIKIKNALFLCFKSDLLDNQHRLSQECGATWDYPEIIHHLTLSYDVRDFDFTKLEPPDFPLIFGEETIEELNRAWPQTQGLRIGEAPKFAQKIDKLTAKHFNYVA